jgi:integrase
MAKLWSYATGHRGLNRVRVYERRNLDTSLYIEWREGDKRVQQSLASLVGKAVTDKHLAMQIADEVARAREHLSNRKAREAVFGRPKETHTIGALFDALWARKSEGWSVGYLRNVRAIRRFWENQLGLDRACDSVSAAEVEDIAAKGAKAFGWSSATHHRYLALLVEAYEFARSKLKWWGEEGTLSAVDFPKIRTTSRAYTDDEVVRLLKALRKIDVRAWAAGEIAYATGRRIGAIRTLTRDAVHRTNGLTILRFPAETDKARRSGLSVLTVQAVEAVDAALALGSEYLLPSDDRTGAIPFNALLEMLRQAEQAVGIKAVKGRAWHGIKRRFASNVDPTLRRAASKQSGTTEQTLRDSYEQDDLEAKVLLAKHLELRREP